MQGVACGDRTFKRMPCNQRSHACGIRALTSDEARRVGSPRRCLGAACSPSRMAIEGTWPALRFRPICGKAQGLLRRRSGTNHITATAANKT